MGRKHRLRRELTEKRVAAIEAAWALSGVEGGRWQGRGLLIGWDVVVERVPWKVHEGRRYALKLKPSAWTRVPNSVGHYRAVGLEPEQAMRAVLDLVAPRRFFNPTEAWECDRRGAALICAVLSEDAVRVQGAKGENTARELVLDVEDAPQVSCIVEPMPAAKAAEAAW